MGSIGRTLGNIGASIFAGPVGGALASAALAPPGRRASSLAGAGLDAGINKFNPFRSQPAPEPTPQRRFNPQGNFFTPEKQKPFTTQGVTSTNVPIHTLPANTFQSAQPKPTFSNNGGPRTGNPFSSGGFFSSGGAFSKPIGGGFSISSGGPRVASGSIFNRR